VISVAGLFFACGASEYTRSMAQKYLSTAIGLGLQLMMLYMLLGVGQHVGENWAEMTKDAASQHQLMPMLVILAAVIVYYMVIKHIPVFIASMSGASGLRDYASATVANTLGATYFGMSMAGKVGRLGGGVVRAGVQAGTTATNIGRTAQAEFKNHGVNATGFAQAAKSNMSHIASSAVNTVKDISKGDRSHLSFGQKFNRHFGNKVRQMATSRNSDNKEE
jgi:type IV secretion system protein VirB6/type IV secretion system protein TrbL